MSESCLAYPRPVLPTGRRPARTRMARQHHERETLCERNAVAGNPVDGVRRPMANGNEGSTPALNDAQARTLLDAPPADTLKSVRDRAILATLLYHGIRRKELCRLKVRDVQSRQGVVHFRIQGKGDKIRFVPVHPMAQRLIEEYLALAGHALDAPGSLFRPVKNNRTPEGLCRALDPASLYRNIVRHYGLSAGTDVNGLCVHSLRATALTKDLQKNRQRRDDNLCAKKNSVP
jgi:integrase/recombinase XerD